MLSSYLCVNDTSNYFESHSLSNFQKVVNKELRNGKKWLNANKLALNIDKTNFVILHSAQNSLNDSMNIKICNQYVKQAKYMKFLGLLFG